MRPLTIAVLTTAVMTAFFAAGLVLPQTGMAPSTKTPAPFAACAAPARPMSRLELIFGAAKPDGTTVGDAEWLAFVDDTITPRFPEGFTVLGGHGQWRNAKGQIVREPSRVLLVWHGAHARTETDISAIRETYKQRFGQDSVMRVDGAGCVAF